MSILRPNNDDVAAHYFSKEGASHAEDKQYLLSSKGQDSERLPLAKGCGNFNGIDNGIYIEDPDRVFDMVKTAGVSGEDIPFSVTFWINSSNYFQGNGISHSNSNVSNWRLQTQNSSGGVFFFILESYDTSGFIYAYTTNATFNAYPNQWLCVIATYDGLKLETGLNVDVYNIKGNFLFSFDTKVGSNYNGQSSNLALTSNINIGALLAASRFGLQKMYDVRIYKTELTAEQKQAILKFEKLDSSANLVGQWLLEEKAGSISYDSHNPYTIIYESDFSLDTNGWTPINVNISANIDNIFGENNVLRAYANALNANHILIKGVTGGIIGKTYTVKMRYYIPSSNTTLKRVDFSDSNVRVKIFPEVLDEWVTISHTWTVSSTQFRLYTLDTVGNRVFTGADIETDDLIYIKDIVFTETDTSNHGTINGDLTNFWYEGVDVPWNFANEKGYSGGIDFTAENGYLSRIKNFASNDFTLEFEMYLLDKNKTRIIVQYGTNSNFNIITVSNTDNIQIKIDAVAIQAAFGSEITNRWINVRIERVAGEVTIYEDSVARATNTATGNFKYQSIGGRTAYNNTDFIGFIRKWVENGVEVDLTSLSVGRTVGGFRPAATLDLDAIGRPIEYHGAVRHRAKVKDVNVGTLDGTTTIQFNAFPVGFTFTNGGTATGVAIDSNGLLTGGAGTIFDLQIFDGGTLVNHYSFNEGQGYTVKDLIGNNDGTWIGHTDPNQWGKSDDAIDYTLIDTKLRGGTSSKIDFNPYGALGEAVPTNYEAEGLVPTDAYMYMNQTFIPSPTFGTEADAAITNMEIKEPYERQFVADFVEELVAQGNYALIDEQMLLGLRHGAGLKMMKGSVNPINNGAVYLEGVGYRFNGAEYIDTTFNPSTNGVGFTLNDGQAGAFIVSADNLGSSNFTLFGVKQTEILQIITNTIPLYLRSINITSEPSVPVGTNVPSNSLLLINRKSSAVTDFYRNGVTLGTGTTVATSVPNNTIFIGARNNASSPQLYLEGVISSFIIGAGVGFDQLAYYNSLVKVQTKIEFGNKIKDILIYNNQLQTADDVRRLYSFINEPVGTLNGLQDYEAVALDNLIRNERSVGNG